MNKNDAKEKFDKFIFILEDQITALEERGESYGVLLTRDMSSLEKLEELFDEMTVSSSKEERDELSISFGRYLGEIVRETFGGMWHLPLDDPRNINFNTPVIVGHTNLDGLEFPALGVMRAYSLRGKRGLLRRSIMSQVEPIAADIDHMMEK